MSSYMKPVQIVEVTLTPDTSQVVDGDLAADTQVVTGAMRAPNYKGILQSVHALDEDDQGVAIDLVWLDANVSLGTENSAVAITDANARSILGITRIGSGDWIDLGGSRSATLTGLGLVVKPATDTPNLYVAAIVRGTATYTAAGLKLRIGFLQD